MPVKDDHFVVVGNIAGNDTEFYKIEAQDATHAVNIFCEILPLLSKNTPSFMAEMNCK